jgi:hypothetical protein
LQASLCHALLNIAILAILACDDIVLGEDLNSLEIMRADEPFPNIYKHKMNYQMLHFLLRMLLSCATVLTSSYVGHSPTFFFV